MGANQRMMASAKDILLYWGSGSVACWRSMIVLEEKRLSGYQSKLISFAKAGLKLEELLSINPRGQVPTFKHGDIVINESTAICLYLEAQFKKQGTQLIPDNPLQQAQVLQRMFEAENIHVNGIRKIFWYHVRVKKEDIQEDVLQEKYKVLSKELLIWENYLQCGHNYLCGDSFTMADVLFFTYLAMLVRGSLPFDDRPNLKHYYDFICQRESLQASWPPHFKETPSTTIYAGVKANL